MKTFRNITLILFLIIGFCACEKNDDTPEIEKLPPATQTGEGIFACLVNGEAFIHDNGLINCYYQYVDGGYYFSITGKKENSNELFAINLNTIQKEIVQGETYHLLEELEENA